MEPSKATPADHLANERTFLAWIRTSIGIMTFGFVVEKFGIFLKQISFYLGKTDPESIHVPTMPPFYSGIFGIALVLLGSFVCFLAYIKFQKTRRQLNAGIYRDHALLDLMLFLSVILIGLFLAIYLMHQL